MDSIDEVRKAFDDFSTVCRNIPFAIMAAETEVKQCDQAVTDIEHYLEFNKVNAAKGYELSRMISQYRNRRRDAKDTLETLRPAAILLSKYKTFIGEMDRARGEIRREAQRVNGERKYNPRVLFELFGVEAPKTAMAQALEKGGTFHA